MTHTFCICAYQESRYLEECVVSLMNQTRKTDILIATSTPNDYINGIAEKYSLPVHVNHGEKGISGDWNFAASLADTNLITIAHQDDIYEPEYAEKIIAAAEKRKDLIIAFSGYGELRNGEKVTRNRLLRIKRLMLWPLRFSKKSRFVRRRVLSLGCPICCPAVTYSRDIIHANPFRPDYKSDLDWQQWEKLSGLKGSFVYVGKPLMYHRIHAESATTEIIGDSLRNKEDYQMFRKFWGKRTARFLANLYSSSEKSNNV